MVFLSCVHVYVYICVCTIFLRTFFLRTLFTTTTADHPTCHHNIVAHRRHILNPYHMFYTSANSKPTSRKWALHTSDSEFGRGHHTSTLAPGVAPQMGSSLSAQAQDRAGHQYRRRQRCDCESSPEIRPVVRSSQSRSSADAIELSVGRTRCDLALKLPFWKKDKKLRTEFGKLRRNCYDDDIHRKIELSVCSGRAKDIHQKLS